MSQESLSLFEDLEETETSEQVQAPNEVSDVEVKGKNKTMRRRLKRT